MKRVLQITEVALYLAFMIDCVSIIVSAGGTLGYFPQGGLSLIVILLLISVVQRLRGGKHYLDQY